MERKPKVVRWEKVSRTDWRQLEKRVQEGTASEWDLTRYREKEAYDRMARHPDGHLGWLVQFLNRNLHDMREGEWTDLGFDVLTFRAGTAHYDARGVEKALIQQVQGRILEWLKKMIEGQSYQVNEPATWTFYKDPHTQVPQKLYSARFLEGFFHKATDLLTDSWARLRWCQRCRKLFLAYGRKAYCSPRCSQQVRWEQFKKKHPKRQRDYRAERHRRKERTA